MRNFDHGEGTCRKIVVRIVSDEELDNPVLIRDARNFAANMRVPRRRLLDWLADGYRDSETQLLDELGNRAFVSFDLLELEGIDDWFKDWAKRPPQSVVCRVRAESRERVRVVITILRLIFPKETRCWGLSLDS